MRIHPKLSHAPFCVQVLVLCTPPALDDLVDTAPGSTWLWEWGRRKTMLGGKSQHLSGKQSQIPSIARMSGGCGICVSRRLYSPVRGQARESVPRVVVAGFAFRIPPPVHFRSPNSGVIDTSTVTRIGNVAARHCALSTVCLRTSSRRLPPPRDPSRKWRSTRATAPATTSTPSRVTRHLSDCHWDSWCEF
jgi:hypothetical protein